MFMPRFMLRDFEGESNRLLSGRYLRLLCDALTGIDVLILQSNPSFPNLYDCGVFYKRDPKGEEDWCDCREVLRRGSADCKSLASWRCAELIVRHNVKAFVQYRWKDKDDGGSLYHIVVQLPNGTIEDPSLKLGMAALR